MTEAARYGLCGGTFDPIHRGHVEPVMSVFQAAGWARVFFIPALSQPFKTDREAVSPFHRFAMAVLATEDDERTEVLPVDLERRQITYTVDTLETLRSRYRDAAFDWVIGDDNLKTLEEWRNIDRIFQLANFVVLNRSGLTSVPPPLIARVRPLTDRPHSGAIMFLNNPQVPISSTDVRTRLRAGADISGLVHPRVERYIHRYRLYAPVIPAGAESMQTR
jgi:nicotinate-nucleotide adenylyltransferase